MSAATDNDCVQKKYRDAIEYYWRRSRSNKRWYKTTRSLVIILGALVTLVASLSAAEFVRTTPACNIVFAIVSPALAALLTITAGFSQTFQWGAAWRDMVINAQRLEREAARICVTDPADRKPAEDLQLLYDLKITETEGFFQRLLGGAKLEVNTGKPGDKSGT